MSDLTKQSELKELVKRIEPPEFVSGDTPFIVKAVDLRNAAYVIRNYCDALRSTASAGVREAWQPITDQQEPPRDEPLLLGWWNKWPERTWEVASGLYGSTKGGWIHGQATHWMRQPLPPSALSDHGVQKSAGSWRPIESAPRDGTGILVKLPDSDMPHTAKFWRGSWTVAWDHSELKGWDAPTHWMPIPELPSDSLLSKTLTEGEKKRPQIETPPANEGSSLSPDGGASS